MSKAERAYERREAGETWAEIAEACGYASASSAHVSTARWARGQTGVAWPVVSHPPRERAVKAAAMYEAGHTWEETALALGYSTGASTLRAATTLGGYISSRSQRAASAYMMRADGALWGQVASAHGYRSAWTASASVRALAESTGLPWPIGQTPWRWAPTWDDDEPIRVMVEQDLGGGVMAHVGVDVDGFWWGLADEGGTSPNGTTYPTAALAMKACELSIPQLGV